MQEHSQEAVPPPATSLACIPRQDSGSHPSNPTPKHLPLLNSTLKTFKTLKTPVLAVHGKRRRCLGRAKLKPQPQLPGWPVPPLRVESPWYLGENNQRCGSNDLPSRNQNRSCLKARRAPASGPPAEEEGVCHTPNAAVPSKPRKSWASERDTTTQHPKTRRNLSQCIDSERMEPTLIQTAWR